MGDDGLMPFGKRFVIMCKLANMLQMNTNFTKEDEFHELIKIAGYGAFAPINSRIYTRLFTGILSSFVIPIKTS